MEVIPKRLKKTSKKIKPELKKSSIYNFPNIVFKDFNE